MLRAKEIQFLSERGLSWSVTSTGQLDLLVIDAFALPEGLEPARTKLLLQLPAGFPDVQTDMFWVADKVSCTSGGYPAATDVTYTHPDGTTWWRWSRHFNRWRSGIDGLPNVLDFVHHCLRESVSAA
jgi:hypothetical protein